MLVETTIVIPLFLVLVLGTVDVTYMFYEWAMANKAAYVGARAAVISNPVAFRRVHDLAYTASPPANLSRNCFDFPGSCPVMRYRLVHINVCR